MDDPSGMDSNIERRLRWRSSTRRDSAIRMELSVFAAPLLHAALGLPSFAIAADNHFRFAGNQTTIAP